MDKYLGFDIGGTKCSIILGDSEGKIIEKETWLSEAERGPNLMMDEFLHRAQKFSDAKAIGVSIGGPLDCKKGVVLSPPNLPGWDSFGLKELIEEQLNLPCLVEHDAAACALAEYYWGDDRGAESLVYLTCGTGFGVGILNEGRVYRGAGGHSLEIGHARFAPDGPRAFGKQGSVEAYCSGTGLSLLAEWKMGKKLSGQEIANLAKQGDYEAMEVIKLHAKATGQVAANICDMLFPQKILLGSMARHLGPLWCDIVYAKFENEIHPNAQSLCEIKAASLGERLQDLSALAAAYQVQ